LAAQPRSVYRPMQGLIDLLTRSPPLVFLGHTRHRATERSPRIGPCIRKESIRLGSAETALCCIRYKRIRQRSRTKRVKRESKLSRNRSAIASSGSPFSGTMVLIPTHRRKSASPGISRCRTLKLPRPASIGVAGRNRPWNRWLSANSVSLAARKPLPIRHPQR
jgi:hypothetical protein